MEHSQSAVGDSEGLSLLAATYAETAAAGMLPRDLRYIDELKRLVEEVAERGDSVIVGRGGQAMLAGRPGVLHVRVVCDPEVRMQRIADRDSMTVEAARVRVTDSDQQREAWHQKYFNIDYRSPYLYHVVVNSGWLSEEAATELIVRLVAQVASVGVGA